MKKTSDDKLIEKSLMISQLTQILQQYVTKKTQGWACWHTAIIPVLRKLRQEDCQLEASLCFIMRFCLKRKKGKKIHALNNIWV
jgi:hypothetical protein